LLYFGTSDFQPDDAGNVTWNPRLVDQCPASVRNRIAPRYRVKQHRRRRLEPITAGKRGGSRAGAGRPRQHGREALRAVLRMLTTNGRRWVFGSRREARDAGRRPRPMPLSHCDEGHPRRPRRSAVCPPKSSPIRETRSGRHPGARGTRLAVRSPYVLSLAHALVLRRIADHPDADAVSISAALRWPLVVVEQLLADLGRQGMITPPTRH